MRDRARDWSEQGDGRAALARSSLSITVDETKKGTACSPEQPSSRAWHDDNYDDDDDDDEDDGDAAADDDDDDVDHDGDDDDDYGYDVDHDDDDGDDVVYDDDEDHDDDDHGDCGGGGGDDDDDDDNDGNACIQLPREFVSTRIRTFSSCPHRPSTTMCWRPWRRRWSTAGTGSTSLYGPSLRGGSSGKENNMKKHQTDQGTLKAGLHVRRKHKHKPRVNRDDASTSTSISHVWTGTTQAQEKGTRLCLRRPGSHVACAYACVVRVNQRLALLT